MSVNTRPAMLEPDLRGIDHDDSDFDPDYGSFREYDQALGLCLQIAGTYVKREVKKQARKGLTEMIQRCQDQDALERLRDNGILDHSSLVGFRQQVINRLEQLDQAWWYDGLRGLMEEEYDTFDRFMADLENHLAAIQDDADRLQDALMGSPWPGRVVNFGRSTGLAYA